MKGIIAFFSFTFAVAAAAVGTDTALVQSRLDQFQEVNPRIIVGDFPTVDVSTAPDLTSDVDSGERDVAIGLGTIPHKKLETGIVIRPDLTFPTNQRYAVQLDIDDIPNLDFEDGPGFGVPYYSRHGGDVDNDGVVSATDLQLLNKAVAGLTEIVPELDANRDGALDELDFEFVQRVINGEQTTVIGANYVGVDQETGEMAHIEIRGMNLSPETTALINGDPWMIDEVFQESDGLSRGLMFIGSPEFTPENGAVVQLQDRGEPSAGVRLQTEGFTDPYLLQDSGLGGSEDLPDGKTPTAPPGIKVPKPNDCCVYRVFFKNPRDKAIRLYAYERDGTPAKSNGVKILPGKVRKTPLKMDRPCLEFSLEVWEEGKTSLVFLGRYDIDCNTQVGILKENVAPPQPGKTQVRAQSVVEITKIDKGKCSAYKANKAQAANANITPGLARGMWKRDNSKWKPDNLIGSGAITVLRAPAVADDGCKKRCWVQAVQTKIERYNVKTKTWEALISDSPHNDNLAAGAKLINVEGRDKKQKLPWFCYGAQFIDEDDNLTLGDGPHIKHRRTWLRLKDGKFEKVPLNPGDKIRRTSYFQSSLVCADPLKNKIPGHYYATFTWGIVTTYTFGGSGNTDLIEPRLVPFNPASPLSESLYDKNRLKTHIKHVDKMYKAVK